MNLNDWPQRWWSVVGRLCAHGADQCDAVTFIQETFAADDSLNPQDEQDLLDAYKEWKGL